MRTIRLLLEYDGTGFAGWQSQENGVAFQDLVTEAIWKMTTERVVVRGASRTDSGVHAFGQVATFRTATNIPCDGFLRGLNSFLPDAISVRCCDEVSETFDSVHDPIAKTYLYLFLPDRTRSPLWKDRTWLIERPFDLEAIRIASRSFLGTHDFIAFQGSGGSVATTVRTIFSCDLLLATESSFQQMAPRLFAPAGSVGLFIRGSGFLRHMVRNIAGTLAEIGLGGRPTGDIERIILSKDRRQAGITAPPQGLYLLDIEYPSPQKHGCKE